VSTLTYALTDSSTMLRRVLRHTTRDPSTLIMAIVLPGVVLLLLDFGFGGAIHTSGGRYIDYLVPGIVLMGACYSASATAVAVATDSTQGIIDRFRTMAIARSAVLTGHVLGSTLRAMLGTALVVFLALAIGFRPTADPLHWLAVTGLVALTLFAIAWIATAMGLASGSASGAASLAAILQILPFLSAAFVPTETMPGWLQTFTANQPMTHIVSALRGLLTDTPVGNHGWLAVTWCAGAAIAGYLWARKAYNRRAER
jgi:ABC-2 type transport system permease protein